MTTEAQIIANRHNAQKSTGPRTQQGKTAISQNALKHGLSARQTIISSESQAEFDLYRDQILNELTPAGTMESILADRIVNLSWRLKRTGRFQNHTIDGLIAKITFSPFANSHNHSFPKARTNRKPFPTDRLLNSLSAVW